MLKTTSSRAVVYFCDAIDGSPIAGARVSLWERSGERWHHHEGLTNEEGFCVIPFTAPDERGSVFVAAALGARQAVAQSGHAPWGDPFRSWRLHASTDRPAYRPGETVHWKIIARTGDGETLVTPTGQVIRYKVSGGMRRGIIREGEVTLNEFGSAWGEFELSTALPLGQYTLQFSDQERTLSAIRFRIEEYRLPQFEVFVHTPQHDGRPKAVRPGERVNVEIEATYYFGAPVVGAEMTVQAFQKKIRPGWPRREYPWLYLHESHLGAAKSMFYKRLTTDENGRALFTFDTAPDDQNDYEYIIEARVTGPSRRQVVGRGVVQVSRQSYRVHVRPLRQLYRPRDTVQVEVRAEKPGGEPMAAEGRMEVIRDRWNEIWIDPQGREVQGTELRQAKRAHAEFPPPAVPGARPWRLKFRGYVHEPILEREVSTDLKGVASFQFAPQQEGYYRIRWTSRAEDGPPDEAKITVWVADRVSEARKQK
ncbi:MAG: hypothetical protein IIB58_06710 [Planctomycetes bacterium]|nr:hypothetical protein [Planctomycetota bacterium]